MFLKSLIEKALRLSLLSLLFITAVLLVFLFLGCNNSNSVYSDVYLIQYEYNRTSDFFSEIQQSFTGNSTNYSNVLIRAGFMSICSVWNGTVDCVPRSNPSLLPYQDLSLINRTNNAVVGSLDPVGLATTFATDIVNPYFVIASLVCVLCAVVGGMVNVLPFIPSPPLLAKLNLASCALAWILWIIGAMWIHVATNSTARMVSESSTSILAAVKGSRAAAMSWTSVAFLTMSLGGQFTTALRHKTDLPEKV